MGAARTWAANSVERFSNALRTGKVRDSNEAEPARKSRLSSCERVTLRAACVSLDLPMIPRLRGFLLLAFWFTSIALIAPFLIALVKITGNENMIYAPVRWFIRAGLVMSRVKVDVEGLERLAPHQTYIFTPNHQSLIEVPLWVAYLPRNVAYLGKKEVFK